MTKLTKEQAVVLTAYTGILMCKFSDFHEYAEKILGRSVWTHEFGDKETSEVIKQKSKEDFMRLL